MTDSREPVVVGVDTHDQNHVAVLLDRLGRRLGKIEIPAERAGYQKLLSWCCAQGPLESAGVEGTGSYGAGLARFLSDQGVEVFEVRRPKRQYKGKSDSLDAEAAARSVLAKESTGLPKHKTGIVESIRILRLLRSSAVKARTQTGNQMRALVVSAPEDMRKLLRPLKSLDRIQRCARFRPDKDWRPEKNYRLRAADAGTGGAGTRCRSRRERPASGRRGGIAQGYAGSDVTGYGSAR